MTIHNIRTPFPQNDLIIEGLEQSATPSWSHAAAKHDWLGIFLIAFSALVIVAVGVGIYLANAPNEYDRIRQACPGKAVDVWSRDGELLAIRCELLEPRT